MSLVHPHIVATYAYELKPLAVHGHAVNGGGSANTHTLIQEPLAAASAWKLYIVQEYCNMGSLAALLASGGLAGGLAGPPATAGCVLGIAWMVASGMAHVHRRK